MLTTRPVSSVSYNTQGQLVRVLEDLIKRKQIDFYAFINHIAEKDETKDHTHLFILPSKRIDTNELQDLFDEFDPNNPTKPLKCLPFRTSKFPEWYLYVTHDERYLASIGQTRKYHYRYEDIYASDYDYLLELYHTIDFSKFNKNYIITDAIKNNIPFETLAANGQIPVQQFNQFKAMYYFLKQATTEVYRGVNPETGELRESHSPLIKSKNDDLPF